LSAAVGDRSWMPKRVPLPPHLPETFTLAQGLEAGLTPARLRASDLDRPYRGIRSRPGVAADAHPEQVAVEQALRYAPRLATGQFFCHATALALHGLPIPWSRPSTVHVAIRPPGTPPQIRGVVGHEFDHPYRMVRGVPVCSPVHAWLQIAGNAALDEVVVIGDALVRRREPLASVEQLQRAVLGFAGHRGVRRLRAALEWIRPRTDSPRETLLRLLIVRAGLPEPSINAVVRGRRGEWLGLGDLVYESSKVVIEYEGEYHFGSEQQLRNDIDRLARFAAEGWYVIRVHSRLLRHPEPFLRTLAEKLAEKRADS